MNRPVREHVARIKEMIQILQSELPAIKEINEKLKTEADLRSLRLALMHYELALEIEHEVIESRSHRGVTGLAA